MSRRIGNPRGGKTSLRTSRHITTFRVLLLRSLMSSSSSLMSFLRALTTLSCSPSLRMWPPSRFGAPVYSYLSALHYSGLPSRPPPLPSIPTSSSLTLLFSNNTPRLNPRTNSNPVPTPVKRDRANPHLVK
jgi:hypothetical protein